MKTVLDVCCGPRMFWFDKTDARTLFIDNRSETKVLIDRSHGKLDGKRIVTVKPDVLASFENLPFANASFHAYPVDAQSARNGLKCVRSSSSDTKIRASLYINSGSHASGM